jgi:hypothetical protein
MIKGLVDGGLLRSGEDWAKGGEGVPADLG